MAEIKNILRMTENGTEDIISKRSKAYQSLKIDVDDLPMTELYELIRKTPGLLRRPIIIDDKRLQIGYNEDEIRRFLPREVRALELAEATAGRFGWIMNGDGNWLAILFCYGLSLYFSSGSVKITK